jgi:hypothetical protein
MKSDQEKQNKVKSIMLYTKVCYNHLHGIPNLIRLCKPNYFRKTLFWTNLFYHSLKWCLLFPHWLELQLVANKIISILSENKQPYKSKQRKNKQETTTHTYHPTNKQRKIVIYTSCSIEKISMYGPCWPFFFLLFFVSRK